MADITNTLTTALRVTGAAQMAATFTQASQLVKTYAGAQLAAAAADVTAATAAAETAVAQQVLAVSMVASASTASEMKLAMLALQVAEDAGIVASDGLAAANTSLAAAQWAVLGPIALIVAGILLITAAIGAAVKGLQAFAEESKAAFQAAVVFKNLGLDSSQLRGQVDTASRATGFRRPELLESAGKLAAAGLQPQQIQTALKTIGDTARATGKDFDQVGNAVERAILGKTRGLAQFGVVFQDTGSKAANFARTMQELNLRFEGASEAFKNTLPGAVENFQNSLQHLFSVIGERLAPVAIKVLNFMATVIDFIADHIDAVLAVINPVLFGMLQLMGKGGDNPMSKVGHGGDPASERTAREIADNTKRAADSVEQQILGGAGTEVRGAFSHLQARLALAI